MVIWNAFGYDAEQELLVILLVLNTQTVQQRPGRIF
jgi:hypothetical protein